MTTHHRLVALALLAAAPVLAACGAAASGQANGSDHRYGGIETDSENRANPPPADLVGDARCDTTASGQATATGEILNRSSKPSDYVVTVGFSLPAGRHATGTAHVGELRPGRSIEWTVAVDAVPHGSFTCEVEEIQRYAS